MRLFPLLTLCCTLVFLSVSPAFPQERVRVQKGAAAKTSISLAGLQVGRDSASQGFLKVLTSDLQRSGWFRPVGRGAAAVQVTGSVQVSGAQVGVTCRVSGSDGRNYLGKQYRHPVTDLRALAHQVADDIVEKVTGHPGIATTRIAMVGTRSSKKELYLCEADGQGLVQLTHDKTVSLMPRWGPRGEKLVYTSFLKRFPDVYMIELASGKRQRIASYGGINTGADISPDGRKVALVLSKDGNPELYVKDLASEQLTRLTKTAGAAESSPSWSPDGSRIAYVSDQSGHPQVYVINRNGGRPRRLTLRGSENVAPDWGPSGWIAYSSRVGGTYQLWIMDPETMDARVVSEGYADFEDPSWARDGRHIACTRTQSYRSQVYILDTMGDPALPLTAHTGDWYAPAWSP